MDKQSNIKIAWKGLSEGLHQFEYEIGTRFFAEIEYSELAEGEIDVTIELIKKQQLMSLNIIITGFVIVPCDRCLEPFEQDIDFETDLIIKVGSETSELDDNIISIAENEDEINLTHYIYESIVLSLPYKKIHPDDEDGNSTCNNDMLNKLGMNKKQKKDKSIDPRWEALKNLKKDS